MPKLPVMNAFLFKKCILDFSRTVPCYCSIHITLFGFCAIYLRVKGSQS